MKGSHLKITSTKNNLKIKRKVTITGFEDYLEVQKVLMRSKERSIIYKQSNRCVKHLNRSLYNLGEKLT